MNEFNLTSLKSAGEQLRALQTRCKPHPLLRDALANPQLPKGAERLAAGEAVAVVTGQQCGLLLGPLLTLYKLATAIATSKFLETEFKIPAVPVFWVQSEDHDFDEIRHAFLPGGNNTPQTLTLRTTDEAPHSVSVKHRILSEQISTELTAFEQAIADYPQANGLISLVKQSYQPGRSICDAFADLIAALGQEFGLVVFDPLADSVAGLHQHVSNQIYSRVLTDYARISELLLRQPKQQVKIRPDSPLCFFHPDGPNTPRFRLAVSGDKYRIVELERSYSLAELQNALHDNSRMFSSSALIRPLFQDSIFPTAIYVGGPAEREYFRQLEPLYSFFEIPQPLILNRASFLLIDERVKRLLSQLNISAVDVLSDQKSLEERVAKLSAGDGHDTTSVDELFALTIARVNAAITPLRTTLQQTDPTLESAFQRNLSKFTELLGSLQPKLASAIVRNDNIKSERLAKLQQWLYPEGVHQERFYCGAYFIGRYAASGGNQSSFLSRLVEEVLQLLTGQPADTKINNGEAAASQELFL